MSSDEGSQYEDNALLFSSSPLRRTRTNSASARRQFQDPFEPLPLLPVSSSRDQAQNDGKLPTNPRREEPEFQHEMIPERFRHELGSAPTYRNRHASRRDTFENENAMTMAPYQAQSGNLPDQQQIQEFEEFGSSRELGRETQQQGFVGPEHGLDIQEHRHDNDGALDYFSKSDSAQLDVSSTDHPGRNAATYSSGYSDDIHSKKPQKFPAHKESYTIEHSKKVRQVYFTNEMRRHEDEIGTPQQYDARFSPLPYAQGSHEANSDEKETSYPEARQIEMTTACGQQASSPHKRMRRDEYFHQLEATESNIGDGKIDRKKLKQHSLKEKGDLRLVHPDDKMFSTKFSFATLCEITRCEFGPADMKGKRRGLSVGFPGLACQHCKGDSLNNGRFFPSSIKTMSDTSKLLMPLYNHLVRCKKCPQQKKDELTKLQREHETERKLQTFGSQKAFFLLIWNRLHGELPSHGTSRGKSFRLLLGTDKNSSRTKRCSANNSSDDSSN